MTAHYVNDNSGLWLRFTWPACMGLVRFSLILQNIYCGKSSQHVGSVKLVCKCLTTCRPFAV